MNSKQMVLGGGSLYNYNINKTKKIITRYNKNNKLLIGFSGGKDSMVILDIAMDTLPKDDIYIIFEDTKLEFKETYKIVNKVINDYYNIDSNHYFETTPFRKDFWDVLDMRHNVLKWVSKWRDCCYYLKKIPLNKIYHKYDFDYTLSGIRKEESNQRRNMKLEHGFKIDSKGIDYNILNPLLEWTDENIDRYIEKNELPINEIYSMGYDRCGCAVCPCPNKSIDYYSRVYTNHPNFYRLIKKRSRILDGGEPGRYIKKGDKFYRHTWRDLD